MGDQLKPPRSGRRARSLWLSERVEGAFGFLVVEHGFLGPELHDHGLRYYSPAFSIEIVYDEREQSVEALACADVGQTYTRARLACLIAESKLGAAQEVKTVARTTHALDVALASQAAVLQRLLPTLEAPGRGNLLKACHAR
ncbi:hypothetical protein ACWCOV_34245 [Kribbella sp. NPDC002412]